MHFKITGTLRETESGLPIAGLIVRAYDQDLLFDDLLGAATSDQHGRFELCYLESDFRELFESRPDLFLTISAPPCRLIADTKQRIRWNAGREEQFDLTLGREVLGRLSPTLPDDQVEGGMSLSASSLRLEKRDGFDLPRIPGFHSGGAPGAPAVPEQVQYLALPLGGDVISLEVHSGDGVTVPGTPNPFPAQAPVPDVGIDPRSPASIAHVPIGFTKADPALFAARYPEQLVTLDRVEDVGPFQLVAARVRPVQWDPEKKTYVFFPNLRYVVRFDMEGARRLLDHHEIRPIGAIRATELDVMFQERRVIPARDLLWRSPIVREEVPHLVITDNFHWPLSAGSHPDGTTRAPTISERGGPTDGDLVAELEPLARWKTARGVRSRVVTVSEIVRGDYGDFTQRGFARDLQEVIRNFLKWAYDRWKTNYVLLAGDPVIVPIRHLVGSTKWGEGVSRSAENPPPVGTCFVLPGTVKIRPGQQASPTEPFSTLEGGLRIPFDREAGSGRLGWYFTTEEDFETKNDGFTRLPAGVRTSCVIVHGPDAVLDDDYYWARYTNLIPSDLYYASLVGPGYSIPGKHDFDSNNNGIYGQSRWDERGETELTLDAVSFYSNVWTGRAAIRTGEQARALVDKVLAYERLERADGAPIEPMYLQRITYAADVWGRVRLSRQADDGVPPATGTFTHAEGSTTTRLNLPIDLVIDRGVPSFRVVRRSAGSDVVIPYRYFSSETNLGWHFTRDATYATRSPTPTRFVIAHGPEPEVSGDELFLDPIGLELAAASKENLRALMRGWFGEFSAVERHYADYFDLSAPPSIVPLTNEGLRASLDTGAHFVSLTGHGWWGGACGIDILARPDFANRDQYFIAFADSCLTAEIDQPLNVAKVATNDPDGGAVAYVGHSRLSWIGVGDNYEEFFWCALSAWRRLGPAAGLRLATGGVRSVWTQYALTLVGDPEMPVWTKLPSIYTVDAPDSVSWGGTFTVTVRHRDLPLSGHTLTVMAGWVSSAVKPTVLLSRVTGTDGSVSFTLPSSGVRPTELQLTIAHPNFKPFVATIPVIG